MRLAAADLTSPEVKEALESLHSLTNIPVDWVELASLPSSSTLFQTELEELQRRLGVIMVGHVSCM